VGIERESNCLFETGRRLPIYTFFGLVLSFPTQEGENGIQGPGGPVDYHLFLLVSRRFFKALTVALGAGLKEGTAGTEIELCEKACRFKLIRLFTGWMKQTCLQSSIAGVSQSSAGLRLVGKPPGALKGNAIAKQPILEQKKSRECEVLTREQPQRRSWR
jgi:hypothetical protein